MYAYLFGKQLHLTVSKETNCNGHHPSFDSVGDEPERSFVVDLVDGYLWVPWEIWAAGFETC